LVGNTIDLNLALTSSAFVGSSNTFAVSKDGSNKFFIPDSLLNNNFLRLDGTNTLTGVVSYVGGIVPASFTNSKNVISREYADNRIAGRLVSSLITTPTGTENDYVVT
jgi:hypothetical protein